MSTERRRIPIVTKRMLAMVALLVLALLPFVAMAKDMPTLDEQLIDAADRDNVALAKTLLDKGADPNARTKGGWMPLMFAAGLGDVQIWSKCL